MKARQSIISTVTPLLMTKKVMEDKTPEHIKAKSKYNDCILKSIKFI
jgi:hypothetical protein